MCKDGEVALCVGDCYMQYHSLKEFETSCTHTQERERGEGGLPSYTCCTPPCFCGGLSQPGHLHQPSEEEVNLFVLWYVT